MAARPLPDGRGEFDALVRGVKELRPLPAIALRLISMADDRHFSAQDLATTIQADQALTVRILRLANSPAFGLPRRITSVREALVLLGFREMRAMALSACVSDRALRERVDGAALDYEVFWVNSLAVAHLAQLLANHEDADGDQAFTAGVVHNVGRLALAQQRPDWLRACAILAEREGRTLHDVQAERLGFTDADLGAVVARTWSFPEPLVEAVERHSHPLESFEKHTELAAIVARARAYARSQGVSDGVEVLAGDETPQPEWEHGKLAQALMLDGGVAGLTGRARTFLSAA